MLILQEKPDTGKKEFRFVQTSEEALSVYSYLHKQMTDPPHSMRVCRKPPCQNLGSRKFQKVVVHKDLGQAAVILSDWWIVKVLSLTRNFFTVILEYIDSGYL